MFALRSRLLQALGVNAVPAWGVLLGGWAPATGLFLFFADVVLGGALLAVRIAVHRAATGKRGHFRRHLGNAMKSTVKVGGRTTTVEPGTLLAEVVAHLVGSCSLQGVLLLVLVGWTAVPAADRERLPLALGVMAAFQVVGLLLDLPGMRARPFLFVKDQAERFTGRVAMLHIVIILGFWFAASRGNPQALFGIFAVLKVLADLGALMPRWRPDAGRPPAWLALPARAFGKGESLAGFWSTMATDLAEEERRDEEVLPGHRAERPGRG